MISRAINFGGKKTGLTLTAKDCSYDIFIVMRNEIILTTFNKAVFEVIEAKEAIRFKTKNWEWKRVTILGWNLLGIFLS